LCRKASSCGRLESRASISSDTRYRQFRSDPLDVDGSPDDGSRWRGPAETLALMPLCRLGLPPRSLAVDAHTCIMVRVLEAHRIQGCRREFLRGYCGLPSVSSSRPHRACQRARGCQEQACGGAEEAPFLTAPARVGSPGMWVGRRNGLSSRTKKLGLKQQEQAVE